MKVLESHKQVLKLLGGYPMDEPESNWKQRVFFVFPLFCIILSIFFGMYTMTFIRQYISVNLEIIVSTFLQLIGSIYLLYAIILVFLMRRKINRIFSKLTEIYEKCE